jgi:methionyl-tRNA synthetase
MISFDDFLKLDLRIAKVLEVKPHPNAEKLYLIKADIGSKTIQLVAGIRPFYEAETLLGKLIVVVTNLEQKSIRGFVSEGMLLAAQDREDISLILSDKDVTAGSKIR